MYRQVYWAGLIAAKKPGLSNGIILKAASGSGAAFLVDRVKLKAVVYLVAAKLSKEKNAWFDIQIEIG